MIATKLYKLFIWVQIPGVFSPITAGNWTTVTPNTTTGGLNIPPSSQKAWQLCLLAPSPGTFSLTVIFRYLSLPLGSELDLISAYRNTTVAYHAAQEEERFGPWDATGGKVASVPLNGNTLLVTYYPPTQSNQSQIGEIAQQAQQQRADFEIEAVLQGTRPVAYSTGQASQGTSLISKPRGGGSITAGMSSNNNAGNRKNGEVLEKKDQQNVITSAAAAAASTSSSVSSSSRTSNATSPATASADVAQVLAERVVVQAGAALQCLPDAACFPMWRNATSATVLLVLLSPAGGRYCTGTLLAGPDPAQQLILTANHCRQEKKKERTCLLN